MRWIRRGGAQPEGWRSRVAPEEVRAYAAEQVAAGFLERDEVLERVLDWLEDELDDADEPRVAELVDAAWAAREAEVADAEDDDYRRLAAAFEELEAGGVVARMDFACCQSCGHTEIRDEEGAEEANGYTFFHQQDTDRIVTERLLYLAFGALRAHYAAGDDLLAVAARPEDSPERQAAREEVMLRSEALVGRQVADTLARHGLEVEWDGTIDQRIGVRLHDWRKPLPA